MWNEQMVQKMAGLAKLSLSPDEQNMFEVQLQQVFSYFQVIASFDLKNVDPLVTPVDLTMRLRHDEVDQSVAAGETFESSSGDLMNIETVKAQIRAGSVSQVVQACVGQITAQNPNLNAIITLHPKLDARVAELEKVPSGEADKYSLFGVPVVVKDNILTKY